MGCRAEGGSLLAMAFNGACEGRRRSSEEMLSVARTLSSDRPSAQHVWAVVRQALGRTGFSPVPPRKLHLGGLEAIGPAVISALPLSFSLKHLNPRRMSHCELLCRSQIPRGERKAPSPFPGDLGAPIQHTHTHTPRMQMITAEPSLVKLDRK